MWEGDIFGIIVLALMLIVAWISDVVSNVIDDVALYNELTPDII